MEKQKILDMLYTARWALNQEPPKVGAAILEISGLINAVTNRGEDTGDIPDAEDPKDPGTPSEGKPARAVLAVIVGHEKKAPGADFALGGSEYDYNSDIAARMTAYAAEKYPQLSVHTIFRDGIGISGAYRKAKLLNPDACLELHFNAFNKVSGGSETLSSTDSEDKSYAGIVQRRICQAFKRSGLSRGVKVLARNDRGGQSLYSMPGSANCLPEPFFGDNPEEAKLAHENRAAYAVCLLDATVEWLKTHGIS